mmetsp:Transcript_12613/g.27390  ORF Transcript_12613/g.27390 Transcript_12613/m.27390 type:complete len:83 (-) Transcript_12613:3186-3434(-)
MQRFFSVFELAMSPFIADTGPAQFVSAGRAFAPASNVAILGPGVIGRSSHHGMCMFFLLDCNHLSPNNEHVSRKSLQRHSWK